MLPSFSFDSTELSISSKTYAGHVPPHKHSVCQLAFSMDGHMKISTASKAWQVAPQSTICIPAATEHAVEVADRCTVYFVHLPQDQPFHGDSCSVSVMSPLVRELVAYLAHSAGRADAERRGCLERMICEQLSAADPFLNRIEVPTDRRAGRIARALLQDPDDVRTLQDWALEVGACERTLSRVFERQTGLTFKKWQQRCRLTRATQLLSDGMPVSDVAPAVGYESLSAFISIFRKEYGTTPRNYQSRPTDAGRVNT